MSTAHIGAKKGDIAETILLQEIRFGQNILRRTFWMM